MPAIDRDTYGIPHIYGATEADVALGFGYAQAQDHLSLMLRNYMEAAGRLAEIDGEAAVETDARTRLWRTVEQAEATCPRLEEATRLYLDAFVRGVNRYMEEHPHEVPSWADRISSIDVLALYRLLHLRLNEWVMPELETMEHGGMSNQWAVAPKKTADGATICAMDPHVPWIPLFRMYEAHLISDDGLNIYGGAPFGLPTIILGHTDYHAWSITINRCDISDLYIERLDPEDHGRYRYEDDWLPIESWETTIRVSTPDGFREERRTLAQTHHGPIVARNGDTAYALRFSAYDIVDPVTPLLDLARARGLDAFKAALDPLGIPMFNIVYADMNGNIYYVYNERCPLRSDAYDWRRPVPGWIHSTEWMIYLPFDSLPQIRNPAAGFLQNCNNAPWYVTTDSGISQEDFPPYATYEELNGRGRRVLAWLQNHDRITVEQMIDLALDEYNITADDLKPQLLQSYAAFKHTLDDADGDMARAAALLHGWNNVGSADSPGMTIFSLWKLRYDALMKDQSGDPGRATRDRLMLDALRETVEYMKAAYGRVEVPWGEVHVLRRGDREFPVGGSSYGTESIRPVCGTLNEAGRIVAEYGSAFTMVVEFGDAVRAWSLVPYGNSERPDSPHYDDQIALWTDRRLKRTRFTREEIEANREGRLELEGDGD